MSILILRSASSPPLFPLSITAGSRLQSPGGRRFFFRGDTCWSLMANATLSEITAYLDDRKSKGFNFVLCSLIEAKFADNAPNNTDGVAPFSTPNDIRTPNDTYFDRCVDIAEMAAEHSIGLLITIAYAGYAAGDEGWYTSAIAPRTTTECGNYATYVANKFSALDNIVWSLWGDYHVAGGNTRYQAMANALRAVRSDWLTTAHCNPGESSTDALGSANWVDLNYLYDYDDAGDGSPSAVSVMESSLTEVTTRPAFWGESRYDNASPSPAATRLRSEMYWATLIAGNGFFYGCNPIWHCGAPQWGEPWSGDWLNDYKDREAASDVIHLKALCDTYDVGSLVYDSTDTVLTAGQGTGDSTAVCAINAAGTLAIAYTPTQKALTIDLTEFAGTITAQWFNPRTGAYSSAGSFSNSGSQAFTPASSGDWVLILEA